VHYNEGCGKKLTCDRIAGDAPKGWNTGYVIAMLVLGAVLMVGFVGWEAFYRYPLMPLHVWKDKNFSLVSLFWIFESLADF